jgi:hypothetical protein
VVKPVPWDPAAPSPLATKPAEPKTANAKPEAGSK